MNKALLKSIMTLNNDTYKELAECLGISTPSVSNKMNEKGTEFKLSEIAMIKKRYNLTPEQLLEVFFNEKVS